MYSMIPFGRMNQSWNDFFDEFERSMFPASRGQVPAFRTDIRDEGDHYLLEADHDQSAERKDDAGKYVCRERRVGSYARSFDVSGIREEGISASYENGVLKLTLPKAGEPEPQSRKIAIE